MTTLLSPTGRGISGNMEQEKEKTVCVIQNPQK